GRGRGPRVAELRGGRDGRLSGRATFGTFLLCRPAWPRRQRAGRDGRGHTAAVVGAGPLRGDPGGRPGETPRRHRRPAQTMAVAATGGRARAVGGDVARPPPLPAGEPEARAEPRRPAGILAPCERDLMRRYPVDESRLTRGQGHSRSARTFA